MNSISTKGLVIRMILAFSAIVIVMMIYPKQVHAQSLSGQNIGKLYQQGDYLAQQNKHLLPPALLEQHGRVRYHEIHQGLANQPNANLIETTKPGCDAIGNCRPMADFGKFGE